MWCIFLRKKSSQKDWPTFPESYKGLQVNCCKFTKCENFGIPPEASMQRASKDFDSNDKITQRQANKHHPLYTTSGQGKYLTGLECKACNLKIEAGALIQSSYTLKSNRATMEEYERLSRYLRKDELKCEKPDCPTQTDDTLQQSFKKRGYTNAGTPRYECNHCKKTTTLGEQTRPQKRPEVNIRLFDLILMHMPMRRVAKHLNISPQTLYDKIDFIHKQCLKFVAERERRLLDGKLKLDRLYLSTDRQIQTTNWTKREDKRNTELYGISTACLTTGYVFAFNFNFDEQLTQAEVEDVAEEHNDNNKPKHHRYTARIWLEKEFALASKKKKPPPQITPYRLGDESEASVKEKLTAVDLESYENIDGDVKLPSKGVLVHNEYTMAGHFLLLKELMQHVEKTRFYMDQDTGMKNAYLSIFKDNILAGTSEGFLLRTSKSFSVDQKRKALAETNKLIKAITGKPRQELSSKEFRGVVNKLIQENLDNLQILEDSPEMWLEYPIATMPEPEKLVSAITNISRFEPEHQANLYRKASLHAVDRFFMQSRRSVNLLERPFTSATNKSRTWHGYSAYNPAMLTKMADIFRVHYNYVKTNDKGETPAMRLGLAKGPVALEKIIYLGKYDRTK